MIYLTIPLAALGALWLWLWATGEFRRPEHRHGYRSIR